VAIVNQPSVDLTGRVVLPQHVACAVAGNVAGAGEPPNSRHVARDGAARHLTVVHEPSVDLTAGVTPQDVAGTVGVEVVAHDGREDSAVHCDIRARSGVLGKAESRAHIIGARIEVQPISIAVLHDLKRIIGAKSNGARAIKGHAGKVDRVG
jgi:hypothetical protein